MSTATIIREIPASYVLKRGNHEKSGNGRQPDSACFMEFESWLAGKPWTDRMPCACPVIGTFMRSWNDSLPDDETRTRVLRPLQGKIAGSKSSPEAELARVMLCIDWVCREFTPAWLDLVPALKSHADAIRATKPVQSWEDLDLMLSAIRAAKQDSYAAIAASVAASVAAARAVARAASAAAARDAAIDAAINAATAAARAVARAASAAAARDAAIDAAIDASINAAIAASVDAATAASIDAATAASAADSTADSIAAAIDAAIDAATAASVAAARAAARAALSPTTARLQESAQHLVQRMLAVK